MLRIVNILMTLISMLLLSKSRMNVFPFVFETLLLVLTSTPILRYFIMLLLKNCVLTCLNITSEEQFDRYVEGI